MAIVKNLMEQPYVFIMDFEGSYTKKSSLFSGNRPGKKHFITHSPT